jgi:hypothetical protein
MARPTDDPKTYRLDLRFPPDLVDRVDEFRRLEPDIPPRAEAIRRLVELGLKADDDKDLLIEKIMVLRHVAIEWAQKAGADDDIIQKIKGDDPGLASGNFLLRNFNPEYMTLPEVEELRKDRSGKPMSARNMRRTTKSVGRIKPKSNE